MSRTKLSPFKPPLKNCSQESFSAWISKAYSRNEGKPPQVAKLPIYSKKDYLKLGLSDRETFSKGKILISFPLGMMAEHSYIFPLKKKVAHAGKFKRDEKGFPHSTSNKRGIGQQSLMKNRKDF